jgi:hypothetical protein
VTETRCLDLREGYPAICTAVSIWTGRFSIRDIDTKMAFQDLCHYLGRGRLGETLISILPQSRENTARSSRAKTTNVRMGGRIVQRGSEPSILLQERETERATYY